MSNKLIKKKKGFTLIELIIVMAILVILATAALPRLGGITVKAKKSADIANARTIVNAISILQAEGKIDEGTFELGSNKEESKVIENYLQTIPKTSSEGNFTAILNTDGKITVKDGTNVLFPE